MRRFSLGGYPAIGIAQARAAARETHHLVRNQGADPVATRRRERARAEAAPAGIGTLQAILDLYERQRGLKLRTWSEYRASIRRVFGDFLSGPLADLRPSDLQLAADAYSAQQQSALAVRCLRPVLKWASAPSRCYCSPELARITPPASPQRRSRVLAREELAKLLPVFRASGRPYAKAMLLMLLTLARRDEVCGARWGDVNFESGVWSIPATATKNRLEHRVALSWQAVELLRTLAPQTRTDDALIFATTTGSALTNWDRETRLVQLASKTAGWHRHDLRRSSATLLGEMGEMPHVIEVLLNHAAIHSTLATTYNLARYRPAAAAALQRLADALDAIEGGSAAIIPLATRQPGTQP